MEALRRLAPRGPLAPRRLLLALLAVTAILVGLLAMHTLSGGGHAAHEAGIAHAAAPDGHAAPAAAAAHGDHAGHAMPAAAPAEPAGLLAALDCSDDGCEGLAAMAAGCVLALLALFLVVRPSVAATLLRLPRGVLAERALLLSALTTALVLTGCGSSPDAEPATSPTAAETAPAATSGADASEGNQHDVTFLENMIPHHQQAIDMSEIVLAKDGVDERVAGLAERIRAAQQPEIEEMTALLEEWGYEVDASGGHGGHGMGSGGGMMMSEDDMEALEAADGAEASRLFLEQMIVHHEGAIMMAEAQLSMGRADAVGELAQRMLDDQTAEIAEMRQLLTEL